jgi:hypothetical protein
MTDRSKNLNKISEIFKQLESYYGKILYLVNTDTKTIRIGYIEKMVIKPSYKILKNNNRTVTIAYEKFVKKTRLVIKRETGIEFDFVYDETIYKSK